MLTCRISHSLISSSIREVTPSSRTLAIPQSQRMTCRSTSQNLSLGVRFVGPPQSSSIYSLKHRRSQFPPSNLTFTHCRWLSSRSVVSHPSKHEFVFTLCRQLYTGDIPFPNRPDPSVILFVAKGGRPSIPVSAEALGLNTKVWELTKRCWHKNPEKRPNASQVLLQLESMPLSARVWT